MKTNLRRIVTIGLMSGSLALSALAGGAAVGAASVHEDVDNPVTVVAANTSVTLTPEIIDTLPIVSNQVFNDDRRN